MNASTSDMTWIILCSAMVMVMQGGFVCFESGLVRSKNSINVAIKNLMVFCMSSVLYFTFGFAVMFGASQSGWFGISRPFLAGNNTPGHLSFFILQMLFCCTTATIVCGAVSERMRLPGYVLIVAIITGLIYPLFGHWVWNGLELGMPRGWLARRGFIDFGGSTVIHSVGGWSALAAVLVVGPRLKRFETKDTKLHGHNLPMAVLGVMLLWFGWIGFLGGCGLGFTEIVPMIVLNTMMAGAFGGMTALAVSWLLCQRSDVYLAMQGVISGLVAISAGCHIVTPSSSVAIGCIGAIVGMSASSLLERFKVDDVVAAFPAFGCAGIWGTLAVAFFGTDSAFQLPRSEQLLVQILGVLVCFVWSFGLSLIILRVTNHLFPFRVIPSHEHIGLNVAEHHASTEILDLLTEIEAHQRAKQDDQIEMNQHTEAGQIAMLYNKMVGNAKKDRAFAEHMKRSEERLRKIIDTANDAFIQMSSDGIVQQWNVAAERIFGSTHDEAIGKHVADLLVRDPANEWSEKIAIQLIKGAEEGKRFKLSASRHDGTSFPVEVSASIANLENGNVYNIFLHDISERIQLELKLSQSRKLESIGQLAAGVAHEINTPTQFVGDNTLFLKDSFGELASVLSLYRTLLDQSVRGESVDSTITELQSRIEEVDLQFLEEEIPSAIEQSLDGVNRVASIVRAMKQFSHPGGATREDVDINRAIENTVTVSRGEWKYVADLQTDFADDLPLVPCFPNEINQVLLNLMVNAGHAIHERLGDSGEKGEISITTQAGQSDKLGEHIAITIRDTGCGIPDEIIDRIYDPFFTTKRVGRGTGQGLSLAYSTITERHSGSIEVESKVNEGTTFTICLPLTTSIYADDDPQLVGAI